MLDLTPNGHEGSVWMSGAGLAADSAGNIYPLLANGTFDTTLDDHGFPSQGDYGNAFVKLSTANGGLAVADYFTMSNTVAESNADEDLGSGGALVLPDMTDANGVTRHLAVGAGKDQTLYLVGPRQHGEVQSQCRQHLPGDPVRRCREESLACPPILTAAFIMDLWVTTFWHSSSRMPSFRRPPFHRPAPLFAYPGATPSISANGTSNAIVWATENTNPAVLHAYDATDLSKELYNSNQAGTRDQFGTGNKFITPTIANGKVYVGTTNGVGAFGLFSGQGGDFSLVVNPGDPLPPRFPPGDSAILAQHDGSRRLQPVRIVHVRRRPGGSDLLGFSLFCYSRGLP